MTFRAKPVVKRSRNPWDSEDRRTFLTNLAFALVVVAALVILVAAVAVNWYNEHLASVGSVAGQAITKDELRDRIEIERWRLLEQDRRLQTQVSTGRITQAQYENARQFLNNQAQQLELSSLEKIIDNRIQASLAVEEGISVTDADIDAKLVDEATIGEARHLWIIEVEPVVSDGELEPSPTQVNDARRTANEARADIEGGQKWEDVAKEVSTDVSTRDQGGDVGWVEAEDRSLDEALVDAAFALEANGMTEVLEGEDGVFRIARVTEIIDESVDALFQTKMQNDGIDVAKYREVVRGDVVRKKLEDKIVAEVTKEGPQRRVSEIYIQRVDEDVPEEAVKVRHILFSPNDEVPTQAASPLPSDDPAWTEAEKEAQAAFETLTENPEAFDETARTESDETGALGTTGSGGKLPGYIWADTTDYVPEFVEAIAAEPRTDGEIIEPFRSDFGYHLVQVQYHPTDKEQMDALKRRADGGEDFAQLARDYSESETGGNGGDLGWIARGQLDEQQVDAIFAAEVGGTSAIIEVEDDGYYVYKVQEEEIRTPEGRQLDDLRANAFSDWYSEKKEAVEPTIDRGEGSL